MGIDYDIFDRERTEQEAKSATVLAGIYHKGHTKGWDGVAVLNDLLAKHNGINIPLDKSKALAEIFNVILWGELAAWKVSAELAFEIEHMEAKMAATSQAHDEARHFYVMHNYLKELGHVPDRVNSATEALLNNVMDANSLGKKLLGMQLMVEPIAITIFRFVRDTNVEPVLCELLKLYEIDEARHIALGVQYLPEVIKKMSFAEKVRLALFQIKLLSLEVEGLKYLEDSLLKLGIDPKDVYSFAEKKQMDSLSKLANELGIDDKIWNPIAKVISMQKDLAFSKKPHLSFAFSITTLLRRILLGS